jgi:uncharacterized protein involved in response to NO
MAAIPRYRAYQGPALLAAGFRPFFLLAGLAATAAIPLWLLAFTGMLALPSAFPPLVWHGHEMVFGFGEATLAGFLFTAIPNWTGRMPLQGAPLAWLALLWALGRVAVACSDWTGAGVAAVLDLGFPVALVAVVARELITGRNWRNLPILAALGALLAADLLVHLGVLGLAPTARLGNRLGVAVLLTLISLMGGRLAPSFTRNWLARALPGAPPPAPFGALDRAALGITVLALLLWAADPDATATAWAALVAGALLLARLARWQGWRTWREPLLFVLHLGYAWLAAGFLLLGAAGLSGIVPVSDAAHALTAGAIGTMTLAVMTRATRGHTGRPLHADPGTSAAYALVSVAALLRLAVPLSGAAALSVLALAGAAWSGAFALFVALYAGALGGKRLSRSDAA